MRRNLATLLFSFLLIGCWDFEALTDRTQRQGDGGSGPDLYSCTTTVSATRETCDDGIDNNDDCLVDCADPQCADFLGCLNTGTTFLGYGNKVGKTGTCSGSTTVTDLKQTLSLLPDCAAGCGCDTTNAACNSTLHWYNDGGNTCNTEVNKVSVQSKATADCRDIANPMSSYNYKLDNVTSACPVDTSKKGTLQSSWAIEDRICAQTSPCETLACVKSANINCLIYDGDTATCPAGFTVRTLWYQSVTDNRVCNCQCASDTGSCTFNNGDASLYDATTCGGTKKDIAQNQLNTCISSPVGGGGAKSVFFQPKPICKASGTASTDLAGEMTAGRVKLNTALTTCCAQ